MRTLLHRIVWLFAMLALLTPSFAALAVDVAAPQNAEEQMWVPNAQVIEIPAYKPCQKQGGKRVLPCRSDVGLLRDGAIFHPYSKASEFVFPIAEQFGKRSSAIDLPPPRNA